MTISATTNMNQSRKTAWSGKVLIPLWTIQILATLVIIIGYIWFLATYNRLDWAYYYDDSVNKRSVQLHVLKTTAKILTINAKTGMGQTRSHTSLAWFFSYSISSPSSWSSSRLSGSTRRIYLPKRCSQCRSFSAFSLQSLWFLKSWGCSLSSLVEWETC